MTLIKNKTANSEVRDCDKIQYLTVEEVVYITRRKVRMISEGKRRYLMLVKKVMLLLRTCLQLTGIIFFLICKNWKKKLFFDQNCHIFTGPSP